LLFVGHPADGNMHVNVLFENPPDPAAAPSLSAAVKDCVFAIVDRFGGSITAEHGIGTALHDRLPAHVGDAAASLMRGLKRVFDPLNILNPGKVIDASPGRQMEARRPPST
jgi:FAD/FMN-containing dehydrogenase